MSTTHITRVPVVPPKAKRTRTTEPKLTREAQSILAASSNPKATKLRVRGGNVEAYDRYLEKWLEATAENWYVYRRTNGLHLHVRSRQGDREYRDEIKKAAESGAREVKARSRGPVEIDFDAARKVYLHVLENWAVARGEVVKGTELDRPVVDKALRVLETAGLIASSHVDGEHRKTFQSFHDVANERGARAVGKRDFEKWAKAEATTAEGPEAEEQAS